MIKYRLKITTNSLWVLDEIYLTLSERFSSLYNFKIIDIDGITNGEIHLEKLKNDIRSSKNGLNIKIDDMRKYLENFIDIFDLTIVGNLPSNSSCSSVNDSLDELIYKNDFIVELFDSTYWQILSSNRHILESFIESVSLNKGKSFTKNLSDILVM